MRHIIRAKRLFESYQFLPGWASTGWAFTLGCASGIAVAYYAAARFGLAFLSEDVAVFWPASGIAVGILVTLGQRVQAALVIGVVTATVAANLTVDSLWPSVLKGVCSACEPVFTAWLIERWFGRVFAFDDLRHVLGFAAASCIGAAASAVGGAATMVLFHATAAFWDVWRTWLLAGWVGIILVAPLVIGLREIWREPPSLGEWTEALGALALTALVSFYTVSHESGSWLSFSPGALVLPLLLWLTARCAPAVGGAGAFIASSAVIWATTFGVGRFGDAAVPLTERVKGAQAAVTTVTICTLVLAALFAERRRNEAVLKLALLAEGETKSRLADAMAAGQVMAFEWNAITGVTRRDNATQILGFEPGGKIASPLSEFLRQVHADDRERFEACIRELRPNSPSYALIFRFVRPDGRTIWLEETAKGEFDATGRLLGIKGLKRDITEPKELEEHKNLLIGELDHRVKNLLSTVLVIVSHTRVTSSSMAEFVIALDGRIRSLARTHELLSARSWKGLRLSELVHRELAPFATANNTRMEGSDEILTAEAGQVIAMVLHELATNAAKYGALSGKDGHVSVRWSRVQNGETENILCIYWEENGGPIILPPTRTGYGTIVIRDLISYELGGTVDLIHARDGVRCKIEVPAHWLIGRLPAG